MKFTILLIYTSLMSTIAKAETLDEYIKIGLDNNLTLKQKNFDYKKSIHALKEARGKFFPSISIEARYTRAGGGREIEFPVADLLNPLYNAHGIKLDPPLQNEIIPFLREEEQETKIRLVQPLFQYALFSNYNLKDNLNRTFGEAHELYKQQLIKDIKTSYYKFIQTRKVVDIYTQTLDLVIENVRVSEVLFNNDMATQDVIYRARAEQLNIEQELAVSKKNYTLAQSYFNFLLNRDLETEIDIINFSDLPQNRIAEKEFEELALQHRKEISQLEYAINASKNLVGMSTANYYPAINFILDYGVQGEKYSFAEDDDFWMASVVASWNLFNGFQDSEKRQQAIIDTKIREAQLQELKQQIRLQVKDAYYSLIAAGENYEMSLAQEKYNKESYKILLKKYEEGLAPQIELIDARVNMTNAQITTIIHFFDYLIKYLQLQQITGSLTNYNNQE